MLSHLPDYTSTQFTRSSGDNNPLLPLPVVGLERSLAERVLLGERCDGFRHFYYESIGARDGLSLPRQSQYI